MVSARSRACSNSSAIDGIRWIRLHYLYPDEIDEKLSELGIDARRREGWETADWLLLDYETVIVHLFRGEVREFYSLERLWRDAQEVDISNMVKPN